MTLSLVASALAIAADIEFCKASPLSCSAFFTATLWNNANGGDQKKCPQHKPVSEFEIFSSIFSVAYEDIFKPILGSVMVFGGTSAMSAYMPALKKQPLNDPLTTGLFATLSVITSAEAGNHLAKIVASIFPTHFCERPNYGNT